MFEFVVCGLVLIYLTRSDEFDFNNIDQYWLCLGHSNVEDSGLKRCFSCSPNWWTPVTWTEHTTRFSSATRCLIIAKRATFCMYQKYVFNSSCTYSLDPVFVWKNVEISMMIFFFSCLPRSLSSKWSCILQMRNWTRRNCQYWRVIYERIRTVNLPLIRTASFGIGWIQSSFIKSNWKLPLISTFYLEFCAVPRLSE